MPLNAFAQLERELGVPLVPRPLTREIGHDRIQTSLRFLLIIHYQIVEYAMAGPWPAIVDSSWMDMLAGLSKK
jgi:hypothetical protein